MFIFIHLAYDTQKYIKIHQAVEAVHRDRNGHTHIYSKNLTLVQLYQKHKKRYHLLRSTVLDDPSVSHFTDDCHLSDRAAYINSLQWQHSPLQVLAAKLK